MALVSLLTRRPAKPAVAMTGELTLSGTILQIAGLREKLLAAQRAGMRTVVIPQANTVDLAGMDRDVLESLEIVAADDIQKLIEVVLEQR
jgi:ATP-dependent Lon protease